MLTRRERNRLRRLRYRARRTPRYDWIALRRPVQQMLPFDTGSPETPTIAPGCVFSPKWHPRPKT